MPLVGTSGTATTATVLAQPKWIGKSWTIWGGIIAAASAAAPIISAITGADITAEDVNQVGAGVANVAQGIGGLVGLLMVFYGRLRKDSAPVVLGSTKVLKEVIVPNAVKVEKAA